MKVFVAMSCLLAFTYAEPPVGDGYPGSRSGHHHDHSDLQRSSPSNSYLPTPRTSSRTSLSQTYGPPSARNGISQQYGAPGLRSSAPSQEYGTPGLRSSGISQEYGTPNLRSGGLSQEYGARGLRSGGLSQEYGAPGLRNSGPSQEYGVPSAGLRNSGQDYSAPGLRNSGLSQEYGVPNLRNAGLDQEYGVPNLRSSELSQSYAPPAFRNGLSEEYGAPALENEIPQDFSIASLRSTPQDTYGAPFQRSSPSSQYGAPELRSPSEEYGVPQSNFGSARSATRNPSFRNSVATGFRSGPAQTYGAPNARSQGSGSGYRARGAFTPPTSTVSRSFGAARSSPKSSPFSSPALRSGADSYSSALGYPSANARQSAAPKSISQEYGTPSQARNLKTSAFASSYAAVRSPAQKYGAPSVRGALDNGVSDSYGPPSARVGDMPSEQYGVPEQYNSLSSQGYSYARNALDELANQEPANYDFSYKVNDFETGSDFGHTETRQDNRAEGSYFVVLPDGTKQVVEYEADERGFKPRISVEPAEARSGGYDDNAADISAVRSGDGPY